jgi:hypothetical protein
MGMAVGAGGMRSANARLRDSDGNDSDGADGCSGGELAHADG